MINKLLYSLGLTKKIIRPRLEKFLEKHRDSSGFTLDIGCGGSCYAKYFPNRIGFDIKFLLKSQIKFFKMSKIILHQ